MKARGFSLVEVLIALTIGGLLLTMALASAATLSRRQSEGGLRARLSERAAHALTVLEPELQMAGFGGLNALASLDWPGALPAAVLGCGTLGSASAPPPVRVDEAMWSLRCPASGGGAALSADVLTVARAESRAALPEAGRLQVLTRRASTASSTVLANGRLPAGVTLREGLAELHDLGVVTFYVARRSDGNPTLPALRMKELTSIGGVATWRDVEIVDGVEDLHVEAGWRTSDAADLQFTVPASRPAERALEAVRVHLRLRSDSAAYPPRATRFAYGQRIATFDDGFQRLTVQRTFALRNASRG